MQAMNSSPLFFEEQSFRQLWLRVLIYAEAGFVWYVAFRQLLLGRPFGDNPMPDWLLVIFWLVFGIGFPALFFSLKLITEVRPEGLYLRFFPLQGEFHRISFNEVKSCEACTYRPIRDYGGWGVRYGRKGKAYNVSGNRGVRLELSNGKSLLIGSQRAEELAGAIREVTRSENPAK